MLCVFSLPVGAQQSGQDVMAIPPLDSYIVDYTNTLTASVRDALILRAQQLERDTKAQLAVLLIADRQGYELYDIALKVARETALGDQDTDSGLLLVVAVQEKKLRIMVGYGLEGAIPDVQARLIVEQIRPLVEAGDMDQALTLYYDMAESLAREELTSGAVENAGEAVDSSFFLLDVFLFIVFFLWLFSSQRTHRRVRGGIFGSKASLYALVALLVIGAISFLFLSGLGSVGAFRGYILGSMAGGSRGGSGLGSFLQGVGSRGRGFGGGFSGRGFSGGGGKFGGGGAGD